MGEKEFCFEFEKLTVNEISFWLSRFILEIRKIDGDPYPPNTLYHICCGLQRHLRESDRADVNLFDDAHLHCFRSMLASEMKRLHATGNYLEKRKALPISTEQEDRLWEMGLLEDHSPSVLVNTIIWYVGLYFALRSGGEHRRLRNCPSQVLLFEPPEGRSYLVYKEDVSKTNKGGLNSCRKVPKEVVHYANASNHTRCFVRLYKLYLSKCPLDRPNNDFYQTPLCRPKGDIWYSKVPIGQNKLQKTVPNLMKEGGYQGYYTNHSLRVSIATRLFNKCVDEQLIMARTGHSSTDGVQAYK